MLPVSRLRQQFSDAFNAYAVEGIQRYEGTAAQPILSHACFKFSSLADYADYVGAARQLGRVTQEEFNGKEITWCHLNDPLQKDGVKLEWLEMVEPRTEKHPFNGVANIGYCAPELKTAIKLPSSDGLMTFRYQSKHAVSLAPK